MTRKKQGSERELIDLIGSSLANQPLTKNEIRDAVAETGVDVAKLAARVAATLVPEGGVPTGPAARQARTSRSRSRRSKRR